MFEKIRARFKPREIEISFLIILCIYLMIPFLPNHTIDPWELFNPRKFGMLIATISSIQFFGYFAIKLFGERFGIILTGFLGGIVSSTAVFANLSLTLKTYPSFSPAIMASALFAIMAMLAEVVIIFFIASPTLLLILIKPIIAMGIVTLILIVFLMLFQRPAGHSSSSLKNPLSLVSIFLISAFIAASIILVAIAKRYVGTDGVVFISFLGGLFEIHGISLATALLYLDHHLTDEGVRIAFYAALLASFLSKIFLLWSLTPARFAAQTSILLMMIMVTGGLTYWIL